MKINEIFLRQIIRKTLQNEADMRTTGPVAVPDWFGTIRRFFRRRYGTSKVSRGGVSVEVGTLSPNSINIEELYNDMSSQSYEEIGVGKDTQRLMPNVAEQLLYSSPDPDDVSKVFDLEIIGMKKEHAALIGLSITGSLDRILLEVNTILNPLNMQMSQIDIDNILNYYETNENYTLEDRTAGRPPAGIKRFLEGLQDQAIEIYRNKIENVLLDMDIQKSQGMISQNQLDQFNDFIKRYVR
jgi:hypothetical protein